MPSLPRRCVAECLGTAFLLAGVVGSGIMAAAALIAPFWEQKGGVPLEWKLLGIWSVLGILIWYGWVRRRIQRDPAGITGSSR